MHVRACVRACTCNFIYAHRPLSIMSPQVDWVSTLSFAPFLVSFIDVPFCLYSLLVKGQGALKVFFCPVLLLSLNILLFTNNSCMYKDTNSTIPTTAGREIAFTEYPLNFKNIGIHSNSSVTVMTVWCFYPLGYCWVASKWVAFCSLQMVIK